MVRNIWVRDWIARRPELGLYDRLMVELATVKTRRARPLLCVASCASDVAEPRLPVIGQCYGSGVLVLRPRSTRHQQCYRRDEATFFPAFKHVRTYF